MGEPLELQNTTYSLFQKKMVICVLHAKRYVGSSAQTLQVSGGEGNGLLMRIARGGCGGALLEGGCVEGDEAKNPEDEHGTGRVAEEKTSATDDNNRFRPGFCRWLQSPLSHPSFP